MLHATIIGHYLGILSYLGSAFESTSNAGLLYKKKKQGSTQFKGDTLVKFLRMTITWHGRLEFFLYYHMVGSSFKIILQFDKIGKSNYTSTGHIPWPCHVLWVAILPPREESMWTLQPAIRTPSPYFCPTNCDHLCSKYHNTMHLNKNTKRQ